jgi:hypothetical protein
MRQRDFSTENADYTLHYAFHTQATEIDNLESYDAIVLESGYGNYEEWKYSDLYFNLQYHRIIEANEKLQQPRPIFFVDLPPNKFFRKRRKLGVFLSTLDVYIPFSISLSYLPWSLPFLLPFVSFVFSPFTTFGRKSGRFSSYFSLPHFYSCHTLRDAVSAYKIEEFVAPEMKERIKHKPYIFIDYGAGHSLIELSLKHKKLRDFRKKLKSPFDRVFDFSYLNLVQELRHINSPEPSPLANKKIIRREIENEYYGFARNWERILYDIGNKIKIISIKGYYG